MSTRGWSRLVLLSAWVGASVLLGLWADDGDRDGALSGIGLIGVAAGFTIAMLRTGPDHRHIRRAGIVGWMLAALLLAHWVVGLFLYGLTFEEGYDPDPSWFGVAPFITVFLLGGGYLLGVVLAWLVGLSLLVLARNAAQARGNPTARYVSAGAVLLLSTTTLATCVVLLSPEPGESDGRRRSVFDLAAVLLRLVEFNSAVPLPWLVWSLAWLSLLALVLAGVVMVRTRRAHRGRTGTDIDDVG